ECAGCPHASSGHLARPVLGVKLDVGVVTYGATDVAVDALTRLREVLPDARILVHDNASPNGTATAVAAAVPSAQVERGEANLGFSGGMNKLLARSTAPFFLALNPDAWPEPGAVEHMAAVLEAHPRAA